MCICIYSACIIYVYNCICVIYVLHTIYMCVYTYTCTCIVKLTLEQQIFEMHGPTYTWIVFNKYVLQYHTIIVGRIQQI